MTALRVHRLDSMSLCEVLSAIERRIWDDAVLIVAAGNARLARRRVTRSAFSAARRGDYFTARNCFRTAKAIEWLSSHTAPRYMSLH